MITKNHLKEIIEAWPDEQGNSSNPEIYEAWIERERRYDARII